ncbi:MAG: hypothetical protein J2P54_13445, partial [Bradyrhizobiaceae bacterium]|nr:hypothetical protein [Bradyrhizobiaceae bacterium]
RASLEAWAKVRKRWSKLWPAFAFLTAYVSRKEARAGVHSICGFKKRDGMIGAGIFPMPIAVSTRQVGRGRLTDRDIIDMP